MGGKVPVMVISGADDRGEGKCSTFPSTDAIYC